MIIHMTSRLVYKVINTDWTTLSLFLFLSLSPSSFFPTLSF